MMWCRYIYCFTSDSQCRTSNVECRMSRMVWKRLEPCQKTLQRLSDIALWGRKGDKTLESSWRDLQDLQTFAPLRILKKSAKFRQTFSHFYRLIIASFLKNQWKFENEIVKMWNFLTKFGWHFECCAVQKRVNLVDLVKSFQTNIYLQNSASIQPRTSLSKFANKSPTVRKKLEPS